MLLLLRLLGFLLLPLSVSAVDTLALVQPQNQVDETAGAVDFLVARYGQGVGAIAVDVQITPSSAVPGVDYSAPQPTTLAWANGDLTPKVIHLPIIAVAGFANDRYLDLSLVNVSGATVDPAGASVSLAIHDTDPNPSGTLVMLADDTQGNVAIRDDVGTLHLQVLRSGGTQGIQTFTVALVDQDTQVGVDYDAPASSTVQWADLEGGIKAIDLPIRSRTQARGTRTLYGLWSSGSSIPVGSDWTITIADHLPPDAGILTVSTTVTALETAGSITLDVDRTGGATGAVSVDWTLVDDTALMGANYGGPASGTLTWNAGETHKTIIIPLIDDAVSHVTLDAVIVFSNPLGGLIIPPSPITAFVGPGQTGCTLHIADDDHHGVIGFTATSAIVDEVAGSVTFQVSRIGGSSGVVSVDWSTTTFGSSGAVAGTDFTAGSGTLSWSNGASASQPVTITILHAAGTQPDRHFGILLQNPQGGAGVDDGYPGSSYASITIQDVDGGAFDTIAAAAPAATVNESAGSVTVSFVRTGTGVGPAGIQIITQAGSALPVLQYGDPSVSTLTWSDGETGTKSFTIPLVDDAVLRPTSDFAVYAGVAYANAAASASASHTTITILDNDDHAPSITGTPATSVQVGSAYSFSPTGADVDPGDVLTYAIVNRPAWAAFDTTTGMLSGTPTGADVGTTSAVVISVSDGTLSTALAAFDLTVTTAPAGTPMTTSTTSSSNCGFGSGVATLLTLLVLVPGWRVRNDR